ncbi:MAG: DUF1549 and DUF1553 domain-containing protein [Gemmataceae bacterium]|nr:DUF1549 and DUF1553 domain-containing protein [Gemmataceae bacterium]
MRFVPSVVAFVLVAPKVALAQGPASAISVRIDESIEKAIHAADAKPAPICSDDEFLRRIFLDLLGRTPKVREARDFLEDRTHARRSKLIHDLLSHPEHYRYFGRLWREVLVSEPANRKSSMAESLEAWAREAMRSNMAHDRFVREILACATERRPGADDNSPYAFHMANEFQPELLAAASTRTFLGIRLECAQCHDHPFAKWKQADFWSTAAFFVPAPKEPRSGYAPIAYMDGKRSAEPRFVDGAPLRWTSGKSARVRFAEWMTRSDNRQFARASVNRLWAQVFGRGLVDPIDDFDDGNAASHPQLLDELADAFVKEGFDRKLLLRAMLNSRTYQRSSAATEDVPADPRLFARMSLRPLSAEQLFDSFAQAIGESDRNFAEERARAKEREAFLTRFAGPDRAADARTSVLQALSLMNGSMTARGVSPEKSRMLRSLLGAPFLSLESKIETLYLATLARFPVEREMNRARELVRMHGETQALADLLWVLANTAEFSVNH